MKKSILCVVSIGLCLASSYSLAVAPTFSPYIDFTINANWTTTPPTPASFSTLATKGGIHHIRLAFVGDSGNCKPVWGTTNTFPARNPGAAGVTEVKVNLPAANVFYTISFGGATSVDLSKACSQADLINAYKAVVSTYSSAFLEGLDFDIENGTENVPKIVNAIKALQSDPCCSAFKYSFTVATLPNALGATGQTAARLAKQAGIQFNMNVMAMDYGPSFDPADMGALAIQSAQTLHDFLVSLGFSSTVAWSKVQVTPMIGVNDVTSEIFTLANATTLFNFASSATTPVPLLGMWALSRDKPCQLKAVDVNCSSADKTGKPVQTSNYDFTHRFLGT